MASRALGVRAASLSATPPLAIFCTRDGIERNIVSLSKSLSIAPMSERQVAWPHAPEHRLGQAGTYFVTSATYQKQHHFRGRERLAVLHRGLLSVAHDFGWRLEAWGVFSNHYHFVGYSPDEAPGAESLRTMLSLLHEKTAKWINRLDKASGRKVWHNFFETKLTFERSYLARLAYTHCNAVKHGLVPVAEQYPWCSASWFLRTGSSSQIKTLAAFGDVKLQVPDDFEVAPEW